MEGSAAEVIRLFPTFVWRRQLEQQVYGPLNRGILAKLDELMKAASGTPGSAWQSRHSLHELPCRGRSTQRARVPQNKGSSISHYRLLGQRPGAGCSIFCALETDGGAPKRLSRRRPCSGVTAICHETSP
jgi:hypothetical protein